MISYQLFEASPETLPGSFTDDLQYSKSWLCKKLKDIQLKSTQPFSKITVLGSWYGNLGLFLDHYKIEFDNLDLVDINEKALDISQTMLGNLNRYKIFTLVRDANDHYYKDLPNQLVINTSCNDMTNDGWFKRIPNGTMVALQGRNQLQLELVKTDTLEDFNVEFPMRKILYINQRKLKDPETTYDRFLKIGLK